jgi:hypothetical protein
MSDDDVWDEIAAECIQQAERVNCPLEEFARGMRVIETAIRERRQLADAELGEGTSK